ncbi:CBL-interacting serine/threonine-protein kinase 21 isoform X1 [Cannabis sativa]|uniref:CBL-interacting serine/threonine-protein kinase 21 isoform X1 n=1 Tax=Cannabis sativa TaxID=3483 RepID=UPI0029CA234C|nr:CBL-interacting serine/threonine-protein kinase 21 isoform X1 [Cannabis sativa]
MGFGKKMIGKYEIGRTIGEGTFAKVKLGVDSTTGEYVALKVVDKLTVQNTNLMHQVQREIRTMKILHHPNIVRIHEVIGTKTKIYIVMEYVPGGQLSDKMLYSKRLNESEARKLFQQLIDVVDYCHNKGVYHRDLKPENLLLDSKGNIKVSDFGLSALMHKPGGLLSTACGSPSYVAPELIANKSYDGAAADIWSCGVILFELLAGCLPFDDRNLLYLYKKVHNLTLMINPQFKLLYKLTLKLISLHAKITRAQYECPQWFTERQKKLISRLLEPNSIKRITIPKIIEDEWFQKDYVPSCSNEHYEDIDLDDVKTAFDSIEENFTETNTLKSSSFINAFQLIAMSNDLDLSGLFEEKDDNNKKTKFGSEHAIHETIKKIEAAATDVSLSVERMNNFKMKMHRKTKMTRCCRSYIELSAEVIAVTPNNCVIEISKSTGEIGVYREFCKSLSSLLTDKPESSQKQEPDKVNSNSKSTQEKEW